ncbi:uncharacterized protein LOC112048159 [Bicyclus anynana]|uniref:Uncharacterized protein LOC112048159 n=1 Tax=Bicyclus anynana TaxID=110368 RepID=A0ABM3LMU2_BICAN|nr:uncharacterized protein LOC112048159 [Bicyclus anynana]
MKLPFSIVLGQLLKPQYANTKLFCKHPTFSISVPYTYVFSTLGLVSFSLSFMILFLFVNIHHLKNHLGEVPLGAGDQNVNQLTRNEMLVHDLKIIATSMGLVQYTCLLVGCLTENPSLFLPHLAGQLVVIFVRLCNALLFLVRINMKTLKQLQHKVVAIALMTFNWLQEFCVFRQCLCVCDL